MLECTNSVLAKKKSWEAGGCGGRPGTSVVENGGMMDRTYVLALLGFLDSNFEPLPFFFWNLSVFFGEKVPTFQVHLLGIRVQTGNRNSVVDESWVHSP
jgi:hypothetical protein